MLNNTILTFHKALVLQLSQNLELSEIKCKCKRTDCIVTHLDFRIIDAFERLRASCGHKPIIITSAYRCDTHNKHVGGLVLSRHRFGAALDMLPPKGMKLAEFHHRCSKIFDVAILYPEDGFVHVHFNPIA